ncbi:MAG: membrane protein insertion efficiency factor YidD [Parcubacteria group bacterium]|nr:membrane protein insertion efficiency factor YidD [Parcubacteria group bacterium]
MIKIFNPAKLLVLKLIRIYQKTMSFDHGAMRHFFPYGYCRFYPTCSEYGHQAVSKYGVIKGGLITAWRILRCNPWNSGGHDEVL